MEVAARAGLSNASFYYHFRNKAEMVDALAGAVAATLVQEVDGAIQDVQQGTQRVALASMMFIERAVHDPTWGRLIVHALAELREFREQIFSGIRKDVRIGISQGRFEAPDSPMLYAMLLGIVGAAIREHLDRRDDASISATAAEAILRVLGIEPREAAMLVAAARNRAIGWEAPRRKRKPRR
jgi:AcrR family transcriptional regulator